VTEDIPEYARKVLNGETPVVRPWDFAGCTNTLNDTEYVKFFYLDGVFNIHNKLMCNYNETFLPISPERNYTLQFNDTKRVANISAIVSYLRFKDHTRFDVSGAFIVDVGAKQRYRQFVNFLSGLIGIKYRKEYLPENIRIAPFVVSRLYHRIRDQHEEITEEEAEEVLMRMFRGLGLYIDELLLSSAELEKIQRIYRVQPHIPYRYGCADPANPLCGSNNY
jgi:hypothetical protein